MLLPIRSVGKRVEAMKNFFYKKNSKKIKKIKNKKIHKFFLTKIFQCV